MHLIKDGIPKSDKHMKKMPNTLVIMKRKINTTWMAEIPLHLSG